MMENNDALIIRALCAEMREAYANGKNVMELARKVSTAKGNLPIVTLMAYDLQAGSYVASRRRDRSAAKDTDRIVAKAIDGVLSPNGSILEVGCGEATRLAGVLMSLAKKPKAALGFDLSWSRVHEGQKWLKEHSVKAELFVGDLFAMPFADDSIDVVYSSHSLEPNGGREEDAIRECLRVARRAVVLFEPMYELASKEAKARMRKHGYVRGLKKTAERVGSVVKDYHLVPSFGNPLNPTGLLLLEKKAYDNRMSDKRINWQCPLTGSPLQKSRSAYVAESVGLVYPVLHGIPLLRPEHVVVASKWS